jgi:NAD(P)-dependent dehydrogenase (short-subunit alcohol dehydrogenase family)
MSQTWMITGGSRGLGRRIAAAALADGHHVAVTARNAGVFADLEEEYGGRVLAVELDVTDPAAVRRAVETALARFGRLDVVVNNAGQADFGAVEDMPLESLTSQMATNFWGVVHVSRAVLPVMRAQGAGHLVQVSSLGARMGTPGLAAYQAAKAATNVFSMSLAKEVGPLGIKVTIVEPGNLRTEMLGADSMTMFPISEPYQQALGSYARGLAHAHGRQSGDPGRAAAALVRVARLSEPPERLILGGDGLAFAETAARVLAESDDRWAGISRSVDFPAGEPAQ